MAFSIYGTALTPNYFKSLRCHKNAARKQARLARQSGPEGRIYPPLAASRECGSA